MARATSTKQSHHDDSSGVMLLAIDGTLWELLALQAEYEKITPGSVLSKAVGEYLQRHGTEETLQIFQNSPG